MIHSLVEKKNILSEKVFSDKTYFVWDLFSSNLIIFLPHPPQKNVLHQTDVYRCLIKTRVFQMFWFKTGVCETFSSLQLVIHIMVQFYLAAIWS